MKGKGNNSSNRDTKKGSGDTRWTKRPMNGLKDQERLPPSDYEGLRGKKGPWSHNRNPEHRRSIERAGKWFKRVKTRN